MERREVLLRLIELTRGVADGSLGRGALLAELEAFHGRLGGSQGSLDRHGGTVAQLALRGAQEPAAPRLSAKAQLRARAVQIVRYWIVRTGRDPARNEISDDRVRKVMRILKTKTDEEAMQAIANVADSDFHQGENDRGNRYDTIDVIFGRGVEKFEAHRDSGDAPIEIGVELNESIGKQPPRRALAQVKAELAEATERKARAQRGGDRDAFNRWARTERRLRREMEVAAE